MLCQIPYQILWHGCPGIDRTMLLVYCCCVDVIREEIGTGGWGRRDRSRGDWLCATTGLERNTTPTRRTGSTTSGWVVPLFSSPKTTTTNLNRTNVAPKSVLCGLLQLLQGTEIMKESMAPFQPRKQAKLVEQNPRSRNFPSDLSGMIVVPGLAVGLLQVPRGLGLSLDRLQWKMGHKHLWFATPKIKRHGPHWK